jgi:hypothetical protein
MKKKANAAYKAKKKLEKQQKKLLELLSSSTTSPLDDEHGGSTAALPPAAAAAAAAAAATGLGCEVVDEAGRLCEHKRRKEELDAVEYAEKRWGLVETGAEDEEAMRRQMRDDRVRVMDMLMLNLMR